MRAFIFLLFFIPASLLFSQSANQKLNETTTFTVRSSPVFYLENTLNPAKKIKLSDTEISLLIDETRTEPGCIEKVNRIYCEFDSIVNDSMRCRISEEEILVEYNDHSVESRNSYNTEDSISGNWIGSRKIKVFSTKDILYINYKNPFRKTMRFLGGTVLTLSAITLVASPLAGSKLKGDARSTARGTMALAGLSGMILSIPFYVIGKDRRYPISPSYPAKAKNYWILKEKYE